MGTVTVLAQLCFNIVFYYSMLFWNVCSYLATKLLKLELQTHHETCASIWLLCFDSFFHRELDDASFAYI